MKDGRVLENRSSTLPSTVSDLLSRPNSPTQCATAFVAPACGIHVLLSVLGGASSGSNATGKGGRAGYIPIATPPERIDVELPRERHTQVLRILQTLKEPHFQKNALRFVQIDYSIPAHAGSSECL